MRFLWNVFSFLAVVHLLALAGFAGWLWQSGRLNSDRITAIRQMLSPTIEQVESEASEAKEKQKAEAAADLAEQRLTTAPMTSARQISMLSGVREFAMQTEQQLEQERGLFEQQLAISAKSLEDREAAFEARKKQWEEGIEAERRRRNDEQFAKTVVLLELMKPAQAKDTLVRLMQEGSVEQAVAYLNAMSERSAARVLGEMKDPAEAPLATVLLERLRRFGLEGEPDEVLSDVDTVASAP